MIGMEMAVDHRRHVVDRETSLRQCLRYAPRLHLVVGIQLVIAEPEASVEQQQPTPMPDRVADHHTHLTGPWLIRREPELPEEERGDLGLLRATHDGPPRRVEPWRPQRA